MADWIAEPVNWVFLVIALGIAAAAVNVVVSRNLIHAALSLVGVLGLTAALFLILSAEFVAWVIVLVYVGAVIVLFLFGIMITRAPMGREVSLDNERRASAAVIAAVLFAVLAGTSILAFGDAEIATGERIPTETIAESLLGRYLIPFEIVSFVLLSALIGGIVLARRDLTPLEEEERLNG
jgi:NADH-quinone oxidoreductase subunit J